MKTKRQNKTYISSILGMVVLVVGLVVGVALVGQKTNLFGKAASSANGRFGVALGTWNFSKVLCYDINGNPYTSCVNSPVKFYTDYFNDMQVTAYDGSNNALASNAFNVAPFDRLDPSANTQFIWYHYEDNQGYDLPAYNHLPANPYLTLDQMTNTDPTKGASIYATSGAPGSIQVRVMKETYTMTYPWGTTNPQGRFLWNYKIRLPAAAYNNGVVSQGVKYNSDGFPMCTGCIFKETAFKAFLDQNKGFRDNGTTGNWYGFYVLAETEYHIVSQHLTPEEYAAVFNEYVAKLNSWYPAGNGNPTPRFIFESPINIGATPSTGYKPYFDLLFTTTNKFGHQGLLTAAARSAITYMGMDDFFGPPSAPDLDQPGHAHVTDAALQATANSFVSEVTNGGQYLYGLLNRLVLLTQIGSKLNSGSPAAHSSGCPWCNNDSDDWSTTQFGHARLTQLVFRNLNRNSATTKVAAWAYWGNVEQRSWIEPLVGQTWGYLNHGYNWLTWPIYCTATPYNCPHPTSQPWPSYSGMVYLKLANGDNTYRPTGSPTPSWWPVNETY